jgi:hypothetical protein
MDDLSGVLISGPCTGRRGAVLQLAAADLQLLAVIFEFY